MLECVCSLHITQNGAADESDSDDASDDEMASYVTWGCTVPAYVLYGLNILT